MSDARIHDLGYRRYDGPRLGPSAAVRSLFRHTFGALVGRRRSVWAKLLTFVIAGMAFAPALVFLGLAVFIPQEITEAFLPGSEGYLEFIALPVTLFLVLGAPNALCPDRRSGVLALYLASPLDRDAYLVAKAVAVLTFLAIVTVGPALFLLLGNALLGHEPDTLGEVLVAVVRVVVAGLAFGAVMGGLGLALSSLTERRTAAAAGVAMWLIGSATVLRAIVVEALDRSQAWALLDVTTVAAEVAGRVHGAGGEIADVGTPAVVLAALGWVLGTAAFTRWRYHRLQVTR